MLAFKSIILDFASEITWIYRQSLNNSEVSTSIKVGIFLSPNLMEFIQPHVGCDAMLSFQRMLYSQSLASLRPTTEDKHHISIFELRQIGAIAGHSFLTFLDNRLRPQSLAACSKGNIRTLYLLVVGTVFAVGYSSSVAEILGPLTQVSRVAVFMITSLIVAVAPRKCLSNFPCKITFAQYSRTI